MTTISITQHRAFRKKNLLAVSGSINILENPLDIATMTLHSSLIYSINLHIYFNLKT